MNRLTINKQALKKAVSRSSKLEGLSLNKARKDTIAIKLLKKHGRAFTI
jgi:hypothetical protein